MADKDRSSTHPEEKSASLQGVTEEYERQLWDELNKLLADEIPAEISGDEAIDATVALVNGASTENPRLYDQIRLMAWEEGEGYLHERLRLRKARFTGRRWGWRSASFTPIGSSPYRRFRSGRASLCLGSCGRRRASTNPVRTASKRLRGALAFRYLSWRRKLNSRSGRLNGRLPEHERCGR